MIEELVISVRLLKTVAATVFSRSCFVICPSFQAHTTTAACEYRYHAVTVGPCIRALALSGEAKHATAEWKVEKRDAIPRGAGLGRRGSRWYAHRTQATPRST